jgi:recombination protein RecT
MSDITPAVPRRAAFKKLADCDNLRDAFETQDFKDRVAQSLPRHISADRMLRTMVLAASKSPDIYKCDLRQAIGAFLTLSQLGLEPNTPLQHAFLIPFKTKIKNPATGKWDKEGYDLNVILGYPGLADLAFRSGLVTNLHADVVYPGDEFEFEYGSKAGLRHVPMGKQTDSDVPVWAYAHAGLRDGQAFEVMPWSAVMRVRDGSQGFKAALAAKKRADDEGWKVPASYTEAPWVKHRDEMAKKTPWRRLAKWIPKSPELAAAIALEDMSDRGSRPDFGAIFDGNAQAIDGLPEIEQDQFLDAGAAFTVREPEPADVRQETPRAPSTPPKATTRKAATPKPTTPPPAPSELADDGLPAYMMEEPPADETTAPAQPTPITKKWYNVANPDGELLPDTATIDPVVFAERLIFQIDAAEERGEPADGWLEANQETIDDAMAANPEAAELLNGRIDNASPIDRWLVPIPLTDKGTPYLGAYVKHI